jgi:hypothetical protein
MIIVLDDHNSAKSVPECFLDLTTSSSISCTRLRQRSMIAAGHSQAAPLNV